MSLTDAVSARTRIRSLTRSSIRRLHTISCRQCKAGGSVPACRIQGKGRCICCPCTIKEEARVPSFRVTKRSLETRGGECLRGIQAERKEYAVEWTRREHASSFLSLQPQLGFPKHLLFHASGSMSVSQRYFLSPPTAGTQHRHSAGIFVRVKPRLALLQLTVGCPLVSGPPCHCALLAVDGRGGPRWRSGGGACACV